jgi:hypothetical protein
MEFKRQKIKNEMPNFWEIMLLLTLKRQNPEPEPELEREQS